MNSLGLDKKWYVLKGSKRFGSFTYDEMLHMIQAKTLFDFDYVWAQGMSSWHMLADVGEFSHDSIRSYMEKVPNSPAFFKRQHPRVSLEVPLFVHNQQDLWTGKTLSISEGGALVLMGNPTLLPGSSILLNFRKKHAEDVSFNAMGEVLRKGLTKDRIKYDTQVVYAVRFLKTDKVGLGQLQKWVSENLNAG